MNEVNKTTHSTNDYIIAGVTSSTSHENSPPNFAWPVPEISQHESQYNHTSDENNYESDLHTEYRDNYHEWNNSDYNRQIIRPKDHNPILSDNIPIQWQSEYQRTIGTTATNQLFAIKDVTRNEFASKPETFRWTTNSKENIPSIINNLVCNYFHN